jgi:hypothetical protein
MKRLLSSTVLLAGLCAAFAAPSVGQHEHPAGDPEKLGKVSFPVSCDLTVQPQFSSAVAMLHSFWYEKASDTFAAVAEKDPTCGMAYWGIAMTHYHQVWQAPGPADLKAGAASVEKAKSAGVASSRAKCRKLGKKSIKHSTLGKGRAVFGSMTRLPNGVLTSRFGKNVRRERQKQLGGMRLRRRTQTIDPHCCCRSFQR